MEHNTQMVALCPFISLAMVVKSKTTVCVFSSHTRPGQPQPDLLHIHHNLALAGFPARLPVRHVPDNHRLCGSPCARHPDPGPGTPIGTVAYQTNDCFCIPPVVAVALAVAVVLTM
jgi:hypothetical protein